MIRVNVTGMPIVWQHDNSYQQPSITGAIQWNGNTKKLQVSTGTSWVDIDNNITLNCDTNLMNVMRWAEKKMREEVELENLSQDYPAVKDLLNQIKEKQDQLKMVKTLINNGSN